MCGQGEASRRYHLRRGLLCFNESAKTSSIIDMETRLFIAGRYLDAAGSRVSPSSSRRPSAKLAQVASGSADDVNRAVDAARDAADRGPWPRMSADARAGILNKLADGIEKRARDLGMLEARDVGKPVSECVNHDRRTQCAQPSILCGSRADLDARGRRRRREISRPRLEN